MADPRRDAHDAPHHRLGDGRRELSEQVDDTIAAPTLLFVPEDFGPTLEVTCDGEPVEVTREAATGLVTVPCNGAGMHVVELLGS